MNSSCIQRLEVDRLAVGKYHHVPVISAIDLILERYDEYRRQTTKGDLRGNNITSLADLETRRALAKFGFSRESDGRFSVIDLQHERQR
jgi:hypothetical protein